MGLYRQPNDWTCGPFALKHALVALGRLADEKAISDIAHPHWWTGTDEVGLARAARHFQCDLPMLRRTDADRAWGALTRYVDQSFPVLLCVDEWEHWITVVSHEQERFVVVDSRVDPVLQVMTWPQLRNRWQYIEYDDCENERSVYDLHPVKPRFRTPAKARFSVERAQFLRRPENLHLSKHWDEYLEDLMQICRPRSTCSAGISVAEFLRRNQDMLVSRIDYWHGELERASIVRLLRNFRFVAETYALVIPATATRRAIVDMSMLLGMWAAASRGVSPMYGSERAQRGDEDRRRAHYRHR